MQLKRDSQDPKEWITEEKERLTARTSRFGGNQTPTTTSNTEDFQESRGSREGGSGPGRTWRRRRGQDFLMSRVAERMGRRREERRRGGEGRGVYRVEKLDPGDGGGGGGGERRWALIPLMKLRTEAIIEGPAAGQVVRVFIGQD
ncbi:hypothetical protein CPLU01_03895 [Colletotrichum plurivorum]|uniref:Uncharacterized protein n=1 Tax=Colletotrichum plurivorum TaxID=2175906 RepID=A0A8H6KS02_9PEZI|nr:hypothetical protein CPLU01_03895 [Colletotrichum plurivorum]